MDFAQLGQHLKQRRLERQISLTDIGAETRINNKFLEAMEEGNFSILPSTYVRAFLREYALAVGLNPQDILLAYTDAVKARSAEPKEPSPESRRVSTTGGPAGNQHPASPFSPFSLPLGRTLLGTGTLIAAVIVAIILANSDPAPDPSDPATEIPFDRVVRESEAAVVPPRDTSSVAIRPPASANTPDSLRLEMTTSDSVWMSILIDGKRSEEYLFSPNRRRTWVAEKQFTLTMGNAGGATFTLNGRNLGVLGRRGAVIRNTVISEATLNNP